MEGLIITAFALSVMRVAALGLVLDLTTKVKNSQRPCKRNEFSRMMAWVDSKHAFNGCDTI